MNNPDNTGRKLGGELFKPGPEWNGNAKGRPRGSRNKLSEDFLRDLYDAWTQCGVDALKRAAENKPTEFCKMVAGLLPKEIAVKNELSDLTDEQLAALSELIASLVGDNEDQSARDQEASTIN
jgi:hypothetical protein